MKQVDFDHGNIVQNILQTALPMLVAQILNLLYNIVDRIYIGRIPEIGTDALGAVGLCFPVIILVTAFTVLYGSGGSPLFSIERGKGNEKEAERLMNVAFFLLIVTGFVLMAVILILGRPILTAFGASDQAMRYSLPYLRIYILGTVFTMIATGMNPFINAQGFPSVGMMTVVIGAAANIVLDPIFIFALGLGVSGAAVATVISQGLSAFFVVRFLFGNRAEIRAKMLRPREMRGNGRRARNIISLGFASFIMQITNSLVQISCNSVLVHTGGDLYVSIMTIVSSVRQVLETPILAIMEGSSPIISYNYGAGRPRRVIRAAEVMAVMGFAYAIAAWLFIRLQPAFLISIFSSDQTILEDAIPALHIYFSAFIFMIFQYTGQTVFKSLNKKKRAIFFSLFRKVIIVVPLTYALPYAFHMGTDGVFMAEPVSNVIGGLACFITMLVTVLPELRGMEKRTGAS